MPDIDTHLKPAVAIIARMGYIAKGIVYLLIGGLAFMAAAGLGGDNVGTKEAIRGLLTKPLGDAMILVLAVGLFAYALWREIQALLDTEECGKDIKGLATRLGFAISGLIYGSLGIYCIDLLRRVAQSSGDSETQDRTAMLMSHQGGIYVLYAVSLVFVGVGLRQVWRAVRRSYLKNWHWQHMSAAQRRGAEAITRWGLTSRGVVFMIIGLFLGISAWRADPREAQGLGGALDALARQPYGVWLLGAVALGLFGYGLYCLINAGYRKMGLD